MKKSIYKKDSSMIPPFRSVWEASMSAKRGWRGFFILSCVYSVLMGLRVGFSTAINSNYLESRSPFPKVATGTGCRRNLKRRVTLFLNFTCIDLRVRTVSNYFQNRSPARCLGGHRFKSCRELRFFLCPTFVTCWLFRLHICPLSFKFTIFHSFTIENLAHKH